MEEPKHVDEKFCNERHRLLKEQCDERTGTIKQELESINKKLDNHLTHIQADIVEKMRKHYKLAIISIVVITLFILIPEADRSAALKTIFVFFTKVF